MSRLDFRLLGDLEVRVDGEPVDPGPSRQRCVLVALLVDADRVVPVDRLVDRVWGEDPPLRARTVLQSYLSRLRGVLATPDLVVARRPGYVITVDPAAVDLHRFRRLVARAREVGDEQALPLLDQSLGLWRDRAFGLLDTPWLIGLRDALDRERLEAELDRNDIVLRRGGHAELLPALTARAAEHPLDERLAGQLVLALHRAGRSAQALDRYERVRGLLAEELGVDPGPALRRMHQQVLTATDDPPAPVHTLPRDVEDFTGRDLERDRLVDASAELTAIDGMAGIGKTALAVHVAHRLADRYPDAQLFVDLHAHTADREPTGPAAALGVLLRSLGTPAERLPPGLEERAALWRAELAGRKAVLVLDDAVDSAQVRPLLPGGPGCRVLVTSRRRLADLEAARTVSLDVLPHADATALFTRVLGEDRAEVEPGAVAEVVRQCGGLPLAIRIAAARLRTRPAWTVAHLVERLRAGPVLAELATGDRSVAAALTLSYQALPPDRRRLFRLLGLHPGAEVDAHAAAALGDIGVPAADRLLEDLLDLHLLHQSAPGRYRFHDLVRAFTAQLSTDTADGDAAHADDDRHAALTRLFDLYLHAAARAMDLIAPREKSRRPEVGRATTAVPPMDDYGQAMAWLERERSNLVAVATHTGPGGANGRAGLLSGTLLRYLDLRGHHEDALAVHGHAVLTARAAGDRRLECQSLGNLGTVYERLGRYADAADHHRWALALAEALDDPALAGRTHNNLGNAHLAVADHRQALAHYRQALDLARQTGDRAGQGRTANNAGIVHERLGQYEAAVAHHRHALDLAADDPAGRAYALHGLGIAHQGLGRLADALAHLGEAMALAEETGNRGLEGYTAQGLGSAHLGLGRYDEAAEHHRHALAVGEETGNRGLQAEALNGLGDTDRAAGRPSRAVAHHRRALALAAETGDRYQQARAHDGLGDALGDTPESRDHRDRALALYTDMGVPEAEQLRTSTGPHEHGEAS
ncbi:AfsR/SARP family transcriptional regulator [Saccharothrix stipae]